MSDKGVLLSETKGKHDKTWGEECTTGNGHKNAEFMGHGESQLRNCAEICSESVKGYCGGGTLQSTDPRNPTNT